MTPSNSASRSAAHSALGSLMLSAGILLLALRGLQAAQTLPAMPRFWHNHESLWWGMALAITAFGGWLLARNSSAVDPAAWRPLRGGRRFQHLILYTRAGCHLCDDAREILDQHALWLPEITEVDIDQEARLTEKYGTCVPVVTLDGKLRFRGRISVVLLRRLIERTEPVSTSLIT